MTITTWLLSLPLSKMVLIDRKYKEKRERGGGRKGESGEEERERKEK